MALHDTGAPTYMQTLHSHIKIINENLKINKNFNAEVYYFEQKFTISVSSLTQSFCFCFSFQSASLQNDISLQDSIVKGLSESARDATVKLLEKNTDSLSIINDMLIPALDIVGKGFEEKKMFLPQLLMSAEAAKASFEAIKATLKKQGKCSDSKGKIVIATVKGDIHDIGKNIVKTLLENYGFDMIDLGKDVEPELILKAVRENNVKLVGLSALMTTTVVYMEETIKLLREKNAGCKIMVGGAVLTKEYADMIGADYYSKDAMGSVRYANEMYDRGEM